MILAWLAACSSNWTSDTFDKKVDIKAILPLPSGDVLIGLREEHGPLAVYRRTAPDTFQVTWTYPYTGTIRTLYDDPVDDGIWMLMAGHPPIQGVPMAELLLHSGDHGDTWTTRHWFNQTLHEMLRGPDGALYLKGDYAVYRSTDNGLTFSESVLKPDAYSSLQGRLIVVGDEVVVSGATEDFRTRDGVDWRMEPSDTELAFTNGAIEIGRRNAKVVVRERGSTAWSQVFEANGRVRAVAQQGSTLWMLALRNTGKWSHIHDLRVSRDGGRTWTLDSSVGTAAGGSGFHVAGDGTVYTGTIWDRQTLWTRHGEGDR